MDLEGLNERILHVRHRLHGQVFFERPFISEEVFGLHKEGEKYYLTEAKKQKTTEKEIDRFYFLIPKYVRISSITEENIEDWKKKNDWGQRTKRK